MTGALRIATLFQIPVRIHWSFLLIFVYVFYTGNQQEWDLTNILWSLGFVLVLFTCVVMHEFGHALTARRYGVQTRDIILSPIGGVARLDHLPERPGQEFLVAIAGPLVNVAIAVVISPYLLTLGASSRTQLFQILLNPNGNYFPSGLSQLDYFLAGLIMLNLMLALFNLIPAFPMDGGRVLRALLSVRLRRDQATRIAAYTGQTLAVAFMIYGVWYAGNFFYLLIGGFVFFAAAGEYRMVRTEQYLRSHTVSDIVRFPFRRLYVTDTMENAIRLLGSDGQHSYLILNQWQDVVGILSPRQIKAAHEARQYDQPVTAFMSVVPTHLMNTDTLEEAYRALQSSTVHTLPVYDKSGRLCGMVDLPGLERFVQLSRSRK